jgi:hypothetical protein
LRLSRVIVRKYRGIKDTGPFEDGTAAWVWSIPSARIVLTSFYYDHHLPTLVQAFSFVLPA